MDISNLPYEHALGDGGPRPTTQVIVIHATDNTASDENEAAYATHRSDKTSAHFYNDGDSVIRGLPLGDIAYGCFWHGNRISVQFELCGLSNRLTDPVLREVAPVVAEVARLYSIPLTKITGAQVRAGAKGVCGHGDITAAFPEDGGTHTDPGPDFPWATFLGYVAGAAGPRPTPDAAPVAPPWPGRYLHQPPVMLGSDVRRWQARMSVRGWQGLCADGVTRPIAVDGAYGVQSEHVCRAFQSEKGLAADGIVGPLTWRAAWAAPIT